jgi:hypothetical protein
MPTFTTRTGTVHDKHNIAPAPQRQQNTNNKRRVQVRSISVNRSSTLRLHLSSLFHEFFFRYPNLFDRIACSMNVGGDQCLTRVILELEVDNIIIAGQLERR